MLVLRMQTLRRWMLRLGLLIFALAILSLSPAGAQSNPPPDGPVLFPQMFPQDIEAQLVSVQTNTNDGYTYWRFEVNSGCVYGDHNYTITFQGDTSSMRSVELAMGNEDVDWNDPQGCDGGSEVDVVTFNGVELGELSGADDSWSMNAFSLPNGLVHDGANTLHINTDATETGCWCVGVNYIEIRSKVGFQVVDYNPAHRDSNRDFRKDRVGINMHFSQELETATIDPSFSLVFRNAQGSWVDVPGTFEYPDAFSFEFIPDADLKDGIRYYAKILGGNAGIHSMYGATLVVDWNWHFYTAVDFNRFDNFQPPGGTRNACGISGQPCDAVELDIYQTSRNKPILSGKNSLARIHARWIMHPDVHPDEQVRRVDFNVHLAGPNVAVDRQMYANRWDRYPLAMIAEGKHTLNLPFTPQDGGNFTVTLTPFPQTNAFPLKYEASRLIPSTLGIPNIMFSYHVMKAGDWAGGVPQTAKDDGLSDFTAGAVFTTDNFPTRYTGFQPGPELTFNYTFTGNTAVTNCGPNVREVACNVAGQSVTMAESLCVMAQLSFARQTGPFIAATVPQTVCPLASAYAVQRYKALMHMAGSTANETTIAHEIGHIYGLSKANNPTPEHRLDIDGTEGWNVRASQSFSASENPGGFSTLMHPSGQIVGTSWIHDNDYDDLLSHVRLINAIRETTAGPYVLVNGIVNLDTTTAVISPLLLLDQDTAPDFSNPTGICQASLLDGGMNVLAQASFTPGFEVTFEKNRNAPGAAKLPEHWTAHTLDEGGPQPFSLYLPWNNLAQSLRIACNGITLATRTRTATTPTLSFTNVSENDTLSGVETINWTSTDPDGAPLQTQAQVSYDNGARWQSLSILTSGNTFTLDTTQMTTSNGVKLRLAGTDGFNTTFATRTVNISNPLRVVITNPRNGQSGVLNTTDIAVTFSAPMNEASLAGALSLHDGAVTTLENTLIRYDSETRTAFYRPVRPIAPGSSPTAQISAAVVDTNGNSLGTDYGWYFLLAGDKELPYVEEISPAEDSLDVPTNAYIQVKFSEALYVFSVTPSSFYITGPGGNVAGATDFRNRSEPNGHRRTYLFFSPIAELEPNTTYTVHLTSAIKDSNGKAMVPEDFHFTTSDEQYSGTARTTGRIKDGPVDTDGNGTIDVLRFMVEIEVRAIDYYNVNAGLQDKNGKLLEWAYHAKSQSPGVYWIPLDFPASAIATGTGGPFKLMNMSIYAETDPNHPAAWIPPYYTLPYRASMFGGIDPDSLLVYLPLMVR